MVRPSSEVNYKTDEDEADNHANCIGKKYSLDTVTLDGVALTLDNGENEFRYWEIRFMT